MTYTFSDFEFLWTKWKRSSTHDERNTRSERVSTRVLVCAGENTTVASNSRYYIVSTFHSHTSVRESKPSRSIVSNTRLVNFLQQFEWWKKYTFTVYVDMLSVTKCRIIFYVVLGIRTFEILIVFFCLFEENPSERSAARRILFQFPLWFFIISSLVFVKVKCFRQWQWKMKSKAFRWVDAARNEKLVDETAIHGYCSRSTNKKLDSLVWCKIFELRHSLADKTNQSTAISIFICIY